MIPKIKNYKEILYNLHDQVEKQYNSNYNTFNVSTIYGENRIIDYEETYYNTENIIYFKNYNILDEYFYYEFVIYKIIQDEKLFYILKERIQNGKIMGYIEVSFIDLKTVKSMYFYPEYQRQGYLKILIYGLAKIKRLFYDMNNIDNRNMISLIKRNLFILSERKELDNMISLIHDKNKIYEEVNFHMNSAMQPRLLSYGPRIYKEGYDYWCP